MKYSVDDKSFDRKANQSYNVGHILVGCRDVVQLGGLVLSNLKAEHEINEHQIMENGNKVKETTCCQAIHKINNVQDYIATAINLVKMHVIQVPADISIKTENDDSSTKNRETLPYRALIQGYCLYRF